MGSSPRNGCVDFSSWSSWSRGLGKSGSKSVQEKKLAKFLTGFDEEASPDKIGQGGHEPTPSKGRRASPTVHNTNPSVIAIGIFARVLFVYPSCLHPRPFSTLATFALCSAGPLPPCHPLDQSATLCIDQRESITIKLRYLN